ncbi:hypothetical protein BDW75DRAFT_212680 [Aspergillus navahoensis]
MAGSGQVLPRTRYFCLIIASAIFLPLATKDCITKNLLIDSEYCQVALGDGLESQVRTTHPCPVPRMLGVVQLYSTECLIVPQAANRSTYLCRGERRCGHGLVMPFQFGPEDTDKAPGQIVGQREPRGVEV